MVTPPIAGDSAVETLVLAWVGCFTHCVSPTCAPIMAIAFGVDGPVAVWWKLSNSAKRSAYCHRNGMVSQSTWPITTWPFCFVCKVGLEVGATLLLLTTVADVEASPEKCKPSWSSA